MEGIGSQRKGSETGKGMIGKGRRNIDRVKNEIKKKVMIKVKVWIETRMKLRNREKFDCYRVKGEQKLQKSK